jgi:hypothetical protein
VPEVAQVFPDLFSNPVTLLAPGSHFLAPLFAKFPRSLAGFLTRFLAGFQRPLSGFATPLPEAVPIAPGGKHCYSQQAKDQQLHAVIDEGNSDLFRKILD